MLTVVTYLWGSYYQPLHVQQLARSVKRWLPVRHRFVCISDRPVTGVRTLPQQPPTWGRCYRRLWLFSPEAVGLGTHVLHLDLDLVICGPLDVFTDPAVDFRIYKAGSIAARGYSLNPSVLWLRTGSNTDIWTRFLADPGKLAREANAAGFWGSDQAVISHLRQDVEVPTFGDADGLVSFRRIRHEHLTDLPPGTRIVSFHGRRSPFEREVQLAHPWIGRAWKEAA